MNDIFRSNLIFESQKIQHQNRDVTNTNNFLCFDLAVKNLAIFRSYFHYFSRMIVSEKETIPFPILHIVYNIIKDIIDPLEIEFL